MARRRFVDVEEGQVHVRTAGGGDATPLVMLHASPASALLLEPMLDLFGESRPTYAPDNLGCGDSSPPAPADPDVAYFADATVRALDALGLDRVDLHGTASGANHAIEIAIRHPRRVRKLVLDGVSLMPQAAKRELYEHYAPPVALDDLGSQINFAWHFCRGLSLFFPWYRTDAEHRTPRDLPDADRLHDKTMEVLKSVTTYGMTLRAAFRYDAAARLPLVRVPTLATPEAAEHVPGAQRKETPAFYEPNAAPPDVLAACVDEIVAFLDAP